ncbi:MAG: NAD(+)/NADH kinase [Myxococcales bacterium]|nr:NAD(+)/NADH kinase [Myxococcales bacterium]
MRIGFTLKPDKTDAAALLAELVTWLTAAGHTPVLCADDHAALPGLPPVEVVPDEQFAAAIDFAVVLGGDGTMLRACRLVTDDTDAARSKPVLGVNMGQLGFLTGFLVSEAKAGITAAVEGKLAVQSRMRLRVSLVRPNSDPLVKFALNDAVIHQGAMARLVDLSAAIDDAFVSAYRADGLIVATPTGSTAYNMAAGGPIVLPGQDAMVMTPICSHALTNRPLVFAATSVLRLTLPQSHRGVLLTVDGQWAQSFLAGDTVEITRAATPFQLLSPFKNHFDILREKLHWGMRSTTK